MSEVPRRERTWFFQFISIFVLSQELLASSWARKVHDQNIQRMSLIIECSAQFAQQGSFDTSDNDWIQDWMFRVSFALTKFGNLVWGGWPRETGNHRSRGLHEITTEVLINIAWVCLQTSPKKLWTCSVRTVPLDRVLTPRPCTFTRLETGS